MSALIRSCDCGCKIITQSGRSVELAECECPWPETKTLAPPSVRSRAWVAALAQIWERREADERAEAARWGTGLLGSVHGVKADIIAELRAEMVSAATDQDQR